jgi:hypothetical protein
MRIVILPRPRVGRLGAGACCCGRLPAAAGCWCRGAVQRAGL